METDGFYHGAHGGSLEEGVAEIRARYESLKAELQRSFVAVTKKLEAELEHLNQIGPAIEHLWASVQERFAEQIPPSMVPALVALLALFALLAEAKLLSPSMDLLYVTEPDWQLFTAWGLVSIAALTFHFAWESLETEQNKVLTRLIWRAVACGFAVALIFWGILRGYQVAFAANFTGNPLGNFLNGHPILSSIFFIAVTLGTPVAAASGTHYAAQRLHNWYEYQVTKRRANGLSKRRSAIEKMLEVEREQLKKRLESLNAHCEEDQSRYRQHHARGGQFGSVQEPFWTVPLRTMLTTLASAAALSWLTLFFPLLFGVLLAMSWIAAFLYYRRQWKSPDPEEFFENEQVQYALRASDEGQGDLLPVQARGTAFVSRRELTK